MKIEELQDNEGQLIKALSIGNARVDEKIFDLETEIKELKKEKEEIIQTRYGFLEKDKKIISQLELKLEEYNKIVLDYKNKEILIRQLTAEKNQIKEETKNELLYIVQSNIQSIITEHPLSYVQKEEYNFILKTKGFQELEEKLKEIIDANRKLLSENNNLKIALDKLKKKLKDKTEEIKSQAKKIHSEMENILLRENKTGKSMMDCYFYILYKKRKNRSHREKAQTHLIDCPICEKEKGKKFFSFPINPLLIEILKEKGFEDCILFNEKKCCAEMSKLMLKAIRYLCSKYNSKSVVWYRNFLIKKFKPEKTNRLTTKMTRNRKEEIDERFYLTYLSDCVTTKKVDYDVFMKEPKKKCRQYYKEYRQLDQEIKSNVTLYNIDTIDYHSLKKKEKEKIFCEGESYLNGDKKIEMIHIKDKNLNYKLKLEKLNNPKFKQKVKKMLNTLRKSGELVSLEKYNDMKKRI